MVIHRCRNHKPIVGRLIFAILFTLFALGTTPTSAAKNINTISGEVTISPSLNVTIPSSTVSLNLNPLNTDFDSSNLNVTISTNNPSGYTLTMSPVIANTTSLTRVSGTETIPTLTEKTGGYTESEFTTNSWGYKLSSTNYLTFKNTNDITTTNTPSNNDTSIVTFAAKADNTQAAGTYQLEIAFTAIANPLPEPTGVPGKIRYDANSGTVIGQMGDQQVEKPRDWSSCISTDFETYCYINDDWDEINVEDLPLLNYYEAKLYAPNFKNPGYGFAGWNTEPDGTGTSLGPQEDYILPNDVEANGEVLYAMWVKSEGTLQNWTGCSSLNDGDITALTDNRDGNTYAIAKLADHKCWMIENLRLDDSAELSTTNTNNPSLPLTNVYDLGTTSNHLSPTSLVAYDASTAPEGWCSTNSAACYDQSRIATNNTTLFINNTATNYDNAGDVYSYGNYYNWFSAIAGSRRRNSGRGNASGDICPIGWHLPTGRLSSDEFGVLDIALGGTGDDQWDQEGFAMVRKYRSFPNNFVFSGSASSYSDFRIGSRNEIGHYWFSSQHGIGVANAFSINADGYYPGRAGFSLDLGGTVRCLIGNS